MDRARHGTLHHVEVWVPNLDRAIVSWGWLLDALGYEPFQEWPGGRSWRCGPTYIVIEQSPARTATRHDRCRPGLNHLAFHVESRAVTDELSVDAGQHGWRMLFADQYPYAGGNGHYAAYLENIDGFEVELVAPSEAEAEQEGRPAPVPAAAPAPATTAATVPAQATVPVPAAAPVAVPAPAVGLVPPPAPLVRPSAFLRSAEMATVETATVETVAEEPASAGAPPVPGAPAADSP